MPTRARARFIEPMLLLRVDQLPDDPARWVYQLKLDGYRAIAFKTGGNLHLRSRNDNDFSVRYPAARWLKPVLVGQFEFVEWTADYHLRHSRFVALREDKAAKSVKREQAG